MYEDIKKKIIKVIRDELGDEWQSISIKMNKYDKMTLENIEGMCYNLTRRCKFVDTLQCMPNVQYCSLYKKRLNHDWPYPTRLQECDEVFYEYH